MAAPETALKRLQYETMDWARAVRTDVSGPLNAHRSSVQWDPEVWDRDP